MTAKLLGAIQQFRADIDEALRRCEENTCRWLAEDEEPPNPNLVEVIGMFLTIRIERDMKEGSR